MDHPDIIIADDSNFEFQVIAYSDTSPVVVLFEAEWCLTCRRITPLLESITDEFQGRFRLAKVDVDANPQLIKRYQVHSVPTLKTFEHGLVIHQIEGLRTEGQAADFVSRIVPGPENLLLEKAASLLSSGLYGQVEETCLEILQGLPENPAAKLLLAKALIWQGEYLESLTLLTHFPASLEYRQAELLLPLARELMREFSASDPAPDPQETVYRRALELVKQGKFPAALDGLLGVIRHKKDHQGGPARQVALGIFELLGEDHQITREYRPLLASSLF